jgi:hypothetical protein
MKRLAFVLIITLFFSVFTQAGYAQQSTDQTRITFEIETVVPDSSALYSELPTELMDELISYDALSQANIKMIQTKYILRATFVFTDADAFRNWYSSEEMKSLFEKLKKQSASLDFSYHAANL